MYEEVSSGSGETPFKPVRTILALEIRQAEQELERPLHGLLVSGVLAGLGVGVSTMAMAAVLTLTMGELPPGVVTLLAANAYTAGFIIVILAETDLFTEYTTLAILPVLTGDARVASLARLWGLVYLGNLIGAVAFAGLLATLGPALGFIAPEALASVGHRLVGHAWWVVLLSAGLTGWLMGVLSWLVAAAKETVSQIVLIWLVTGVIGLGHMHHAIAGSVDVLAAVFTGADIGAGSFARTLLLATLGNAVGGVTFAALIRYSLVVGDAPARGRATGQDEDGAERSRRQS